MGDRANVTIRGSEWGVYLHWEGSMEWVDALTTYCRLRGLRCEDDPSYGIARLAWVAGCWTGADDGLSVGICDGDDDPGDNGIYTVGDDWRIVAWSLAEDPDCADDIDFEHRTYTAADGRTRLAVVSDRPDAVRGIIRRMDARMPADTQLGELLEPWLAGEASEGDVAVSFARRTERRRRERWGLRLGSRRSGRHLQSKPFHPNHFIWRQYTEKWSGEDR